MAIILSENREIIEKKIIRLLSENAVVFTSDYYAGKYFIKQQASNKYEYYYFCQAGLFSLENSKEVKELQHWFVSSKNYSEAKTFNEFLVNISRIKSLKEWHFYPIIIQLEHTNRCNARCIMCGHANVDKSKCYDMPESTFKRIEKLLPFCKYVGLHGYGEPFLTKELEEKFKIYKKYGVRLYANTNLSYLPETYLPYISDMFDEINISMDGFTKQTYENIRQGLLFEKVTGNFKILNELCPKVTLNIHVTLMKQNILEAPLAIEFAHKNGVGKVVFNEMIPIESNGNQSDSIRNYPAVASYMLKQANQKATELGVTVEIPHELIGNYTEDEIQQQIDKIKEINSKELLNNKIAIIREDGLLFNRKPLTRENIARSGIVCEGICDVFQQQIYIDADGTMAACCVDGYHSTGNLNDWENIGDYWKSNQVALLRESFSVGDLPSICTQCNYIYLNGLKNLKIL